MRKALTLELIAAAEAAGICLLPDRADYLDYDAGTLAQTEESAARYARACIAGGCLTAEAGYAIWA